MHAAPSSAVAIEAAGMMELAVAVGLTGRIEEACTRPRTNLPVILSTQASMKLSLSQFLAGLEYLACAYP